MVVLADNPGEAGHLVDVALLHELRSGRQVVDLLGLLQPLVVLVDVRHPQNEPPQALQEFLLRWGMESNQKQTEMDDEFDWLVAPVFACVDNGDILVRPGKDGDEERQRKMRQQVNKITVQKRSAIGIATYTKKHSSTHVQNERSWCNEKTNRCAHE